GLLDLKGCRFERGSLLGHPPRLEPDGTLPRGPYRWDVERWGLPAAEIELRGLGSRTSRGGSCSSPNPAPVRHCRRVSSQLPWPTRPDAHPAPVSLSDTTIVNGALPDIQRPRRAAAHSVARRMIVSGWRSSAASGWLRDAIAGRRDEVFPVSKVVAPPREPRGYGAA